MTWNCGSFEFDERMPIIMGVLNVTPDSFSDGGDHNDIDSALAFARKMVDDGAAIIDVGGESTRPGSAEVSVEEEIARTESVVKALADEGICVSIDTRHAQVAKAALNAGASIINDVSGFRDPEMIKIAAESNVGLVVMHMKGVPETMQNDTTYSDVVGDVKQYLVERTQDLINQGIEPSRICIDPGPGFGKTAEQTTMLMRNLQEFARLGFPLMIAISRKSFLGKVYGIENPKDRDHVSALESLAGCELGATIVRTHNVTETANVLKDLRPHAVLALGSNVALVASEGEEQEGKIAILHQAITALCSLPDTQIIDISSFYESEPAYVTDQDDFVNAVMLIRTGIAPKELLEYLHAIENSLGRIREKVNGPRTCDIDIVDYQMYVVDADILTLPHPRALERDFVVRPLRELRPNYVFADGSKLADAKPVYGASKIIER